jgi:hypothetical protein
MSTTNACTTVPGKNTGGGEFRYYKYENPDVACSPSGSSVQGTASPQNPVTVCCQSP